MKICKTRKPAWSAAARRWALGALLAIPLSACARTMAAGDVSADAGCASYAEARLARPAAETVSALPAPWPHWIADLDDRMTGTCR